MFSLENFYTLTIGKFMWKLHNNALTDVFKAMFKENTQYDILTRNRDQFRLEKPNYFHKRSSITFNGLKVTFAPNLAKKLNSSFY